MDGRKDGRMALLIFMTTSNRQLFCRLLHANKRRMVANARKVPDRLFFFGCLSACPAAWLHPGKCDYDSITFRMTSRYLMGVPVAGGSVLPNGGAGTGTPVPWQAAVPKMLSWVEDALIFWSKPGAGSPAVQYGARCVSEQRDDANRKQLLAAHCSALLYLPLPACLPACLFFRRVSLA